MLAAEFGHMLEESVHEHPTGVQADGKPEGSGAVAGIGENKANREQGDKAESKGLGMHEALDDE